MADEYEDVPVGTTLAEPEPAPAAPAAQPTVPTFKEVDTAPLAEQHRRKVAADAAIMERTAGRMESDRQRMESALGATGIQPGELPAWDHERQSERFRTDPIEAFGSLGSVFGMIASAFTRAPMENALNASAAAMNAIRDGNNQEFDRAFKAWQANTDLTIKRHNIQQQFFSNAAKMMETNVAAGEAQMKMVATRFGDEQAQFFLDNGMSKELFQMQAARADAVKKMLQVQQDLTENTWRNEVVKQGFQRIDETIEDRNVAAAHKLAIINRAFGKSGTPQQEALGLYLAENQGKPFDQVLQGAQERGLIPRAGGVLTRDRLGAEQIETRAKRYEAELIQQGIPAADARVQAFQRAVREVDQEMARMTGGQIATLEGTSDAYTYSIQTIDRVTNSVKRLTGAVGAPGYVQRAREIVGNLLGGTNGTEYQQVSSDIGLLKTWATRNLLGRDGRPLSAEHANLNSVIQGLNLTDTTQNFLKTMEKVRALYAQMQQDVERRRTRTREAPPAGGPAAPAATSEPSRPPRRPSWEDAPVVAQ